MIHKIFKKLINLLKKYFFSAAFFTIFGHQNTGSGSRFTQNAGSGSATMVTTHKKIKKKQTDLGKLDWITLPHI